MMIQQEAHQQLQHYVVGNGKYQETAIQKMVLVNMQQNGCMYPEVMRFNLQLLRQTQKLGQVLRFLMMRKW